MRPTRSIPKVHSPYVHGDISTERGAVSTESNATFHHTSSGEVEVGGWSWLTQPLQTNQGRAYNLDIPLDTRADEPIHRRRVAAHNRHGAGTAPGTPLQNQVQNLHKRMNGRRPQMRRCAHDPTRAHTNSVHHALLRRNNTNQNAKRMRKSSLVWLDIYHLRLNRQADPYRHT